MEFDNSTSLAETTPWWSGRIAIVAFMMQFLLATGLFLSTVWGGLDFFLILAWLVLSLFAYLMAMYRFSKQAEWLERHSGQ